MDAVPVLSENPTAKNRIEPIIKIIIIIFIYIDL